MVLDQDQVQYEMLEQHQGDTEIGSPEEQKVGFSYLSKSHFLRIGLDKVFQQKRTYCQVYF